MYRKFMYYLTNIHILSHIIVLDLPGDKPFGTLFLWKTVKIPYKKRIQIFVRN